jgi:hypothetical protein
MAKEKLTVHKEIIETARSLDLQNEMDGFTEYIDLMASFLPNNQEALMRFANGLYEVANRLILIPELLSMGLAYQVLSSLATLRASENGLDVDAYNYRSYNTEQRFAEIIIPPNTFMTIDQAIQLSPTLQKEGYRVALLHGHFRLLTPSSIAFIINAFRYTDILFVGVESGVRTIQHKGKLPLLDDDSRAVLFRTLLGFPFLIDDRIPYSDAGYQELVNLIKPTSYIGQTDNPAEQKQQMRLRAERAGIEYIEIKNMPGLSTTELAGALAEISQKYAYSN